MTTITADSPPTFIPSKRRKLTFLRRRPSSPEPTDAEPTTTPALSVRRPQRRFGLEVSAPRPGASTTVPTTVSVSTAPESDALAVVNRFTHQTGQILDVNKHMMAYVESRMSSRTAVGAPAVRTEQEEPQVNNKTSYWAPTRPEARGATLGKLHEVDLGEEAKQRNIELTQAATRAVLTGEPAAAGQEGTGRGRRRRTQQDIERDRLVEEVLKETRLDLYTEEQEESDGGEEGAADDKIAEKFRKEFIDAIISKRRRKGGEVRGAKGKKEDKKRPKGPKLGGSRMARAQMREQEGKK